jgi:splicing suppressor protein 51
MDTERMRRHANKLLTYPITIGSILHQFSNLTTRNQRLTPEGARSLAGEHAASDNSHRTSS